MLHEKVNEAMTGRHRRPKALQIIYINSICGGE